MRRPNKESEFVQFMEHHLRREELERDDFKQEL
jgi:hypothetical protein